MPYSGIKDTRADDPPAGTKSTAVVARVLVLGVLEFWRSEYLMPRSKNRHLQTNDNQVKHLSPRFYRASARCYKVSQIRVGSSSSTDDV